MAGETNVTYTGTIDVGTMLSEIIKANPDSPFVQEFFTNMAEPLIDQIKGAKVTGLQINLNEVLGLSPEYTKASQKEFQRVSKRLLQTVGQQIDKFGKGDFSKGISLENLLGKTPELSMMASFKYQGVVKQFLVVADRYLKTLLDQEKKYIGPTPEGGMPNILGALIGNTPGFSKLTSFRYQGVVKRFLVVVDKYISTLVKDGIGAEPGGTNLLSILLGGTHGFSLWTRMKYQQTVRKLLDQVGKIDVGKLAGTQVFAKSEKGSTQQKAGPQPSFWAKTFDVLKKLSEKKEQTQPKGLIEGITEAPEIVVTDFTENALAKLKKILKLDKGTAAAMDKKTDDSGLDLFGGGISKWLGKVLLPLLGGMLLAGGIGVGISGLMDSGPIKGIKKILGRAMTSLGAHFLSGVFKWIEKLVSAPIKWIKSFLPSIFGEATKTGEKVGEKAGVKAVEKVGIKGMGKFAGKTVLKSLAKKIPIIGLAFGIGFAISRFKQGDWIGGLLEIASGVASLFPVVGTWISVGIDALLAVRDVAEGGPAGIKKAGGMGRWDKKIIDFFASHWPFKGLIEMGKGIGEIFSGNVLKGLKMLGHGFLANTPFGFITDIFGEENVMGAIQKAPGAVGGFFKTIWEWMKNHWPLRGFIEMGEAIKVIAAGDVPKGLKMLGHGILSTTPFGLLSDIFGEEKVMTGAKKTGNFFLTIWEWMKKHWPLRGFIEMGSAIKEIFSGNVGKGLKMLGHGMLSTTPFGLLSDIFGGDKGAVGALKKTGNFFMTILNWMTKHWPLKGLIEMGSAVKEIFSGNVLQGLKKLGHGILSTTPFGLLADMFGEEKIISVGTTGVKAAKNLIAYIWDWLKETPPMKWIGNIIGGIKKILTGNFVAGYRQAGKSIPIFDILADLFENPSKAVDTVKRDAKAFGDWLGGIAKSVSDWLITTVVDAYESLVKHLGHAAARTLLPGIPQEWKQKAKRYHKAQAREAATEEAAKTGDWTTGAGKIGASEPSTEKPQVAEGKELKDQTVQADELKEGAVQTEGPDMDLGSIFNNDEMVKGIEENSDILAALAGTNKDMFLQFKEIGKTLGYIKDNTAEASGGANVSIDNSSQNTSSPPPSTAARDPAYEFKKDIWSRSSRTV